MSQTAAIYARVSSDRQKEQNSIASQTSALQEYAQAHQYTVPPSWVFEDDGFSGSTLVRPALERLRDLIAEGTIETVLVYGPDRLSRNYAHQVLLLEEFARHGATAVFLKTPAAETPEQRLMLQFQGMMAEYERAQIVERCRRGKRYRAKAGNVGVLSAAPYGYQYIRKTQQAEAYYQILEREAEGVRQVFALYTVEGLSIRAIARHLEAQNIPTRSKQAKWTHSTVWHILNNPAYPGRACYGKTEPAPPQRLTRSSRGQAASVARHPSQRRRPKEEWIEIPVPAVVSQKTFDLAQERLELNKQHAARRTKEPSVLQGMLVCEQCGYALCRISARAPGGRPRYHYYRCLGSDRRRPQGRICTARPIRVDQLDRLVWEQVWQLLNQPQLIHAEIQRRLEEHRQSSAVAQRHDRVSNEIRRIEQQTDKLIDAYQEGLVDLGELRARVPALKKRQRALEKELESIDLHIVEESRLVAMNVSMERFVEELKNSGRALDIKQKQRIVRLLIREVVVGADTVTINHSIPISAGASGQNAPISRLCTKGLDGSSTPKGTPSPLAREPFCLIHIGAHPPQAPAWLEVGRSKLEVGRSVFDFGLWTLDLLAPSQTGLTLMMMTVTSSIWGVLLEN